MIVLVAFDGGGEPCQHVGSIEEVGDAPEPLGLTLGAVEWTGFVQSFEGGVLFRLDPDFRCQLEGIRDAGNRQVALTDMLVRKSRFPK